MYRGKNLMKKDLAQRSFQLLRDEIRNQFSSRFWAYQTCPHLFSNVQSGFSSLPSFQERIWSLIFASTLNIFIPLFLSQFQHSHWTNECVCSTANAGLLESLEPKKQQTSLLVNHFIRHNKKWATEKFPPSEKSNGHKKISTVWQAIGSALINNIISITHFTTAQNYI